MNSTPQESAVVKNVLNDMQNRPPITHLLIISLTLAALAIGAWFYTNANEAVEGLPERTGLDAASDGAPPVVTPKVPGTAAVPGTSGPVVAPSDKESCVVAGG